MVDIHAESPTLYWTCDHINDPAWYGGDKDEIWVVERLVTPVISDSRIAFDYPGDWDTSEDFNEFLLNDDGCFRTHREGCNYEAVRSDSKTHVILTGRWTQDGYGSGPFVAVFPKN